MGKDDVTKEMHDKRNKLLGKLNAEKQACVAEFNRELDMISALPVWLMSLDYVSFSNALSPTLTFSAKDMDGGLAVLQELSLRPLWLLDSPRTMASPFMTYDMVQKARHELVDSDFRESIVTEVASKVILCTFQRPDGKQVSRLECCMFCGGTDARVWVSLKEHPVPLRYTASYGPSKPSAACWKLGDEDGALPPKLFNMFPDHYLSGNATAEKSMFYYLYKL